MYRELVVQVTEIIYEDNDIQLLKTSAGANRAMLYRTFLHKVTIGDKILVNSTASELQLGTGGWDIVRAILTPLKPSENNNKGHIMKARYLPSQHSVLSVESQESVDHHLFNDELFSLSGKNILIGELHSMIPVAYSIVNHLDQHCKVTVILSDEAAIPLVMSQHLRYLHRQNNFHSITIGQAFGGQYEAVNLQTALQYAVKKLKSDLIMISLGPGVVGTGTTYGFSGIVQANWANIIGSFSGIPVWIPRISFADKRIRHQGISHHTLTPLQKFTYVKSVLPIPLLMESEHEKVKMQVQLIKEKGHHIAWKDISQMKSFVEKVVKDYPIAIKTMGRGFEDDPAFFLGIAAAVIWCLENR